MKKRSIFKESVREFYYFGIAGFGLMFGVLVFFCFVSFIRYLIC